MTIKEFFKDKNHFAIHCDTEEKANEAKEKVEQWMKEEGYDNSKVYIYPCEMNWLKWYNMEEQI